MIARPGGIAAAVIGAVALAGAASAGEVRLDTPQGPLIGAQVADGAVAVFKGIPYTAPPVGARRWKPATPAPAWANPRLATEAAPVCVQASLPRTVEVAGGRTQPVLYWEPDRVSSEDCLYLNVWTPVGTPGRALRPVMVWIHGGGFLNGSGLSDFYLVPPPTASEAASLKDLHARFGDLAGRFLAQYPADDRTAAVFNAYRDSEFGWRMQAWAESTARIGAPSYLYFFNHEPPGGSVVRGLPAAYGTASRRAGAYHASEIPYVFNNADWGVTGAVSPSPTDRQLADQMSDYWVAFARTGDPNGGGRPIWPKYAPSERRYMRFEDTPRPDRDLLPGMMELHMAIDDRRIAAGIPWDGATAGRQRDDPARRGGGDGPRTEGDRLLFPPEGGCRRGGVPLRPRPAGDAGRIQPRRDPGSEGQRPDRPLLRIPGQGGARGGTGTHLAERHPGDELRAHRGGLCRLLSRHAGPAGGGRHPGPSGGQRTDPSAGERAPLVQRLADAPPFG